MKNTLHHPKLSNIEIKDATYVQLALERNYIVDTINELEQTGFPKSEGAFSSDPEIKYQVLILYLSSLCQYMVDIYSKDFFLSDTKPF